MLDLILSFSILFGIVLCPGAAAASQKRYMIERV